jgi:hypothetical protein
MEEGGGFVEPTQDGVYVPGVRSSAQLDRSLDQRPG